MENNREVIQGITAWFRDTAKVRKTGYTHTVTEIQFDAQGNPNSVIGTVTKPAIPQSGSNPEIPASTTEMAWAMSGQAITNDRGYDLVEKIPVEAAP